MSSAFVRLPVPKQSDLKCRNGSCAVRGETFLPVWILSGKRVEHKVLLALAVWVRVGRRGRRGDGPIAVLLRAVLVRPGDAVVGGRSVLKKRFAVHHLCRPNASSSSPGLCPQLNKLGNRRGQNWSPATCLRLAQKRRDVDWQAEATKTKKTKKGRCAKMKLRPSPCANFVPVGATTNPKSLPSVHFKGRNGSSQAGNG